MFKRTVARREDHDSENPKSIRNPRFRHELKTSSGGLPMISITQDFKSGLRGKREEGSNFEHSKFDQNPRETSNFECSKFGVHIKICCAHHNLRCTSKFDVQHQNLMLKFEI